MMKQWLFILCMFHTLWRGKSAKHDTMHARIEVCIVDNLSIAVKISIFHSLNRNSFIFNIKKTLNFGPILSNTAIATS